MTRVTKWFALSESVQGIYFWNHFERICVNLFDFAKVPLRLLLDLEKSERSIFREIKKGTEDGIENRNKKK